LPDSAPEEYKKLAEHCCDADPDKRPDAQETYHHIDEVLYNSFNSNILIWDIIYHNDVKPLSRLEKESKYSSKLLPTRDLPKPKNSYGSVAGMRQQLVT